ncbi:MAG: TIGR00730 family Rossman fold protein [Ignavibacteriae bacterium HGW-Ignavibacteriae-3]|nr:MAG: TIGR00730 family Rossman fold protein [Ignavibacteriae bacterium HGW-Ignavibacteriae-3]
MKIEHKAPPKAYNNLQFLNSTDARTIRILSEFYEPQARFEKNKIRDTVVFFGSARILCKKDALKKVNEFKNGKTPAAKKNFEVALKQLEMSQYYEDAVELSKRLTKWSMSLPVDEKRFIVCSGGGPGIMEAANKGARLANGHSIGLNISIPFEQFVNKYVDPSLAFEFHYFFMRKFWFAFLAKALVAFPGGFGTLDEMMEVITLIQTGKLSKPLKVIVYGEKYWREVMNFEALIEHGMISKEDLKIFDFCSTVDEAFEKITSHFKKHYANNHKSYK